MNIRKFKKAVKRLSDLPIKRHSFLYVNNKLKQIFLKAIKSTTVAQPSSIMLELTNQCNLHCTTCPREYDFGKAMDKGNMQVEQAKKIIDELWPYLDSVGLTGLGETFLYKELEQVIDYIKSKNKWIKIFISTNAVLPDFIEKVSKLVNKIDTIQVSIDGIDSVYEKIRKNASFIELDNNLRLLSGICKNAGTTLLLNMVITKENFFQMPLLIRYSDKKGIDYMDFTRINLASVTDIEISYYDFYKTNEFLKVVSDSIQTAKAFKGVTVTNINFKSDMGSRQCPYPWSNFYICWNGFVVPCCAKPFPKELNFGSVFDDEVINVLNSKRYRAFRQLCIENRTPDFCQKCHYIDMQPVK
jgi:radical SAM protein with 4Fe4S-binding SPASM domain